MRSGLSSGSASFEAAQQLMRLRPWSGCFVTRADDSRYLDQEYAGRLLLSLNPPSPPDVPAVIKRTLPTWDLSVEQLPMYFEAAIGREAVLQALDMLGSQGSSEQEQRAIETFRFWLRARRDA